MTTTPRLTRDKAAPAPGILHLGPGAFFRAFIAPYVDEAMMAAGGDWGITAVSLQSPRARDALTPPSACAPMSMSAFEVTVRFRSPPPPPNPPPNPGA